MGVFRMVWTTLACEKCGVSMRSAIQFKTGSDLMQSYEVGQELPEDEARELSETYDGFAHRFCPTCIKVWQQAERIAFHQALSYEVENGRLSLKATGSSSWFTPAELLALGQRRAEAIRGEPLEVIHFEDVLRYCDIVWEGQSVDPIGVESITVNLALRARTAAIMKDAGWPHGNDFGRDIQVRVDEARRITLTHRDELQPDQGAAT